MDTVYYTNEALYTVNAFNMVILLLARKESTDTASWGEFYSMDGLMANTISSE